MTHAAICSRPARRVPRCVPGVSDLERRTLLDAGGVPVLAALVASHSSLFRGADLQLTATSPSDSVVRVAFYRESGGSAGLQVGAGGDIALGDDAARADGFSLTVPTAALALGQQLYYAVALDAAGAAGSPAQASVLVQDRIRFAWNNLDGPDEGFNDPTLGAARRQALDYAVGWWSRQLVASYDGETIRIDARMDPLGGKPDSATLASSGPKPVLVTINGTSYAYGYALANHRAGLDRNGDAAEMTVTFNSDVDNPTVLGAIDWSYTTDAQPGDDRDFVTVALHEIAHGLDFGTRIQASGSYLNLPSPYDALLVDAAGTRLATMTDADRLKAATSGALYWDGPLGTSANAGVRPRLEAPATFKAGSTGGHLDESTSPDDLMSPMYSGAQHTLSAVARGILRDLGWSFAPTVVAIRTSGTVPLVPITIPRPVVIPPIPVPSPPVIPVAPVIKPVVVPPAPVPSLPVIPVAPVIKPVVIPPIPAPSPPVIPVAPVFKPVVVVPPPPIRVPVTITVSPGRTIIIW